MSSNDLEDPEQAVEAARDGLKGFASYPWYDSDKDDLRPIEVKAPPPPRTAGKTYNWDGDWFGTMAWGLIAILLAGLAYLLIKAFLDREHGASTANDGAESSQGHDVDRVEALPFDLKRPRTDLFGEARRQYDQGNYSEAIVFLYSYQLVELDKAQFIRLAKGKTNREYLRELGADRPLGRLLDQTMVAFEDVFFGAHLLTRDRFESCWRQVDQFNSLVHQVPA